MRPVLFDRAMAKALFRRHVRFRTLVVAAGVTALASSTVGFAAALAIAPERLTIYSGASTVGATTCTVSAPTADTYAYQTTLSAGTNFGGATTLHVRSEALANKRSFVRFDLSSCGIAAGADIRAAALRAFLSNAPASSRTYDLHRITGAWGETTLTWNVQPTVAASATGSVATGTTSNVTLEWNVLSDVSAFVAGSAPNNGWRVKDATEGEVLAIEGRFSSREHATTTQRPTLVITYYP